MYRFVFRRIAALVTLSFVLSMNVFGDTEWITGDAEMIYDLVDRFGNGKAENALQASASQGETSGKVTAPGIFLHPLPDGEAVWRISLALPKLQPTERLILVSDLGLRDGIPWGDPSQPPFNGVDFQIRIGGRTFLARTVESPGWKPVSCDLSIFHGQTVDISLVTSARGNANYDWAVFGDPEILRLTFRGSPSEAERPANGLRFRNGNEMALVVVANVVEPDGISTLRLSKDGITLEPGGSAERAEKGWIVRRVTTPSGSESVDVVTLAGPLTQCEVYQYIPSLTIEEFAPVNAIPFFGQNIFALRITNRGRGYYTADGEPLEFRVSELMDSSGSFKDKYVAEGPPNLAPGESVVLRRGPFEIHDDIKVPKVKVSLPKQGVSQVFGLVAPTFHHPPQAAAAVLNCGDYRISFPRCDHLHVGAVIEYRGEASGEYEQIGTIYPLTSAICKRGDGLDHWPLIRDSIEWGGEREIHISEDHAPMKQSVSFLIDKEKSALRFTSYLEISEGTREVVHFAGPRVAFGDRSFGAKHGFALFPGLEYLRPEDESSSTLDAANPIAQRTRPDPMKITIPLMAVEYENNLAAMFWDPHQKWQRGRELPGAEFSVPPKNGMTEYSSMGLYVPPPPEWRAESGELASTPIELTPDNPIVLQGVISLERRDRSRSGNAAASSQEGEFIFASLKKYIRLFGLAEPMVEPRSWEEEKALSREAWLNTIWVPEAHGWRHCVGQNWSPAPAPGMATLLLFDRFDTRNPEIRQTIQQRIDEAVKSALDQYGPGFFSTATNCHIMQGEFPFYVGYLRPSLEEWLKRAEDLIQSRREDGSWAWEPKRDAAHQSLGTPGQTTNGICAGSAYFLLKLGRILGDEVLIQAGLKGLDAVERDPVPRGAQGWECPLHAPDILASAYAVRANVEAFQATGDDIFLSRARYWAWSGLPFIYLWNIDSIPSMRYNTIPIFGATFYTHSWFGRPVVWCGLVYAYSLQELARFDQSFNWETIARGITVSSEWQQYEMSHPSKGCYPDSFDLRLNRRNPPDINPEDIMVNALTLRGLDPAVKTIRVGEGSDKLTISSGANVQAVPGAQSLTLRLSFFKGESVYTLISPVASVSGVQVGGNGLPISDNLEGIQQGYQLVPERKWLIVKTKFEEPEIELGIGR
ncbi:MAG TPA: hypothetical protein PLQ35_02180 [bacterium]|nr:hypothetical protein [bacterium]HQL61080.1 hypothetical protein [bacterium]